jgi:crotonobetainyl-CoA:carnitine CoA-transferase CaiB-like acyl-CoA transferase
MTESANPAAGNDPDQALAGLKVIGVTKVVAGPYLEQLLGDMGAEVIHVEIPGSGDDARQIPPLLDGVSLTYLIANRNKKSITLNLKSPRGVELLKRLVTKVDVLIESNRPGVMDRLGISYEVLSAINPRLVMTSISGFGQTGPAARDAGYNQIAQAASGFMSLTGFPDGPPLRTAAVIGDYLASLYAAYGTMVALHYRARTGRGQWVDASLFESMIAVLGPALQEYLSLGQVRQRTGNWAPTMAPSNVYPALDGEVMVVAGNDRHWRSLCAAMGQSALAEDARFITPSARVAHVQEVDRIVGAWTASRTVQAVLDTARAGGIPASAMNTIDRLAEDPQVAARRLIETMDHHRLGRVRTLGIVPKLTLTPGRITAAPPELGEHNREIYGGWLGLTDDELVALGAAGVI